jgi:crotonobetainyl-CoA:carnitine CoA-transferase CaiB-like acyl-CoA transferase
MSESTTSAAGNRPLEGIRVISLEHALAAPLCSRHLADLGAEVIKVERIDGGDFSRSYDTYVHGQSTYFVWLNRGKRSLALNVKTQGGRMVLDRLAASADVLVQNLAPGASARAGLSYERLSATNERLIVADISGYGDRGPFAEKKAYDMLIQAESGLISINGAADTPARVGISVADLATGLYTQNAILAALIRRGKTGRGSHVQVAMLDALAEWMHYPMYRHAYNNSVIPRQAMNNPWIAPYGAHATRDGAVVFSVQNEREWRAFCELVLAMPELTHSGEYGSNTARVANVEALTRLIEAKFADLSSLEVVDLLDKAGIANGRLNAPKDLWEHPQLIARDRWREVAIPGGGKIHALLPPATFDGFEAVMGRVPALGEDTHRVLSELDFSEQQINEFYANGSAMQCTEDVSLRAAKPAHPGPAIGESAQRGAAITSDDHAGGVGACS